MPVFPVSERKLYIGVTRHQSVSSIFNLCFSLFGIESFFKSTSPKTRDNRPSHNVTYPHY